MDRRAALALRQAYRRDAALLLQSPADLLSAGSGCSGIFAPSSSKAVQDALQTNQPRGKDEDKATAATASPPFVSVPPPQIMAKTEDISGDAVLRSSANIDLAGVGRNLVLRSSREAPPPPPPKGRRGTSTAGAAIDAGLLRPEHYCAPCGALFFSSFDAANASESFGEESGNAIGSSSISNATVRVRSIARGRTRRRRAARVRARQAAQDAAQRKDRGGGRQWGRESRGSHGSGADQSAVGGMAGPGRAGGGHGHAVAMYTQADTERRKANALLYNVRDGTKHHCLIFTCGNCGHKTRLAGIDVAARERRRRGNVQCQQQGRDAATMAVHRNNKSQSKQCDPKVKACSAADKTKQEDAESDGLGGGDFISLAPLSKAEPTNKQKALANQTKKASYSFKDKATQSKKAASASRLDQSSNRKRKKGSGAGFGSLANGSKKNAGKKSKLMDFLSSLNG